MPAPLEAGTILIASLGLEDPAFTRTVVLLLQHVPDEMTLGVIINRPLGDKEKLYPSEELESLTSGLDLEEATRSEMFYQGGPVEPGSLIYLHRIPDVGGDATTICPGLFAGGDLALSNWGAGLFVLARFLDHFDGELARQKGMSSKLGYYLDYAAGALSYGALFLCIGIGFGNLEFGRWGIILGLTGAASAVISMFTNLGIDKARDTVDEGEAVGYPGFAGFELEDGIYLIAPITWAGWLLPFFGAASIGAAVYCLWTCWSLILIRKQ